MFTGSVLGQSVIWHTNYGGTYNDEGSAGCRLADGGYVVLGATYSYGAGDHDIYLLRLNEFGDTLWSRSYGGSAADYGYDIQVTQDNGFIITGLTQSYGYGGGDVYLLKVDSTGTLLWSRTYGGTARDEGRSVQCTFDGGFVIAGTTNSFGAGYADVYVVKTNADGFVQWTRTYGGAGGDSGAAVRITRDSGLVIVGSTGSFGTGYSSMYLIRTNRNGDSLWATTCGGDQADFGYSVETTPDGGLILVGKSSSFGYGYADVLLVKTDPSGFVEWQQAYGGFKEDCGYAVKSTPEGGYLVAGTTESFGNGKIDCFVIKIDPVGTALWTNTYGGTRSDYCRTLLVEPGAFFLIGHSYSYTSGGSDVYVVKAHGDESTPVDDTQPYDLPVSHVLAQNYPNPFNSSTTIEFTLLRREPVRLTIYNVLGQVIREWSFKLADAGTTVVAWDGADSRGAQVSSGVYFYRFESETAVATRKMVLLK
jgi:hypothetical protein